MGEIRSHQQSGHAGNCSYALYAGADALPCAAAKAKPRALKMDAGRIKAVSRLGDQCQKSGSQREGKTQLS